MNSLYVHDIMSDEENNRFGKNYKSRLLLVTDKKYARKGIKSYEAATFAWIYKTGD